MQGRCTVIDLITALILVSGGLFALVAAVGVLRLPDVLIRMHASTKAGTLGCGLILVALAVHSGETTVITRAIVAIVFLLLTAPIAAHMIGRAAYRTGAPLWKGTVIDELKSASANAAGETQPGNDATAPQKPRA